MSQAYIPISDRILACEWRGGGLVGIVAISNHPHDQTWKAYIGARPAQNLSQKKDEVYIANFGTKLTREEAQGFFPSLDPEKYKP